MSATSSTSYQSAKIGPGWLLLGVSAVVILAMVTYDRTYGSQIRASIAQQRSAEIEQEHLALCAKLELAPGTTASASCTKNVADFRQRVEQRFAQETGSF